MSQAMQLKHIAIIPDGNGRWAKKRKRPRMFGHKIGAQVLKDIVNAAIACPGLEVLSVFTFSTENKKRPAEEVDFLMQLLGTSLDESLDELHEKNIRLQIIGDWASYPARLSKKLKQSIELTAGNTRLTLVCALFYSGQWDITQATRQVAEKIKNGELEPAAISEETIAKHLSLAHLPDPDLLIRTSGEQRISNFMLWQSAYTEFYFTEKLWPDFLPEDLQRAIASFYSRDRRFGAVKPTREPALCLDNV
jgi:undecaprenyl diphosphate synthase